MNSLAIPPLPLHGNEAMWPHFPSFLLLLLLFYYLISSFPPKMTLPTSMERIRWSELINRNGQSEDMFDCMDCFDWQIHHNFSVMNLDIIYNGYFWLYIYIASLNGYAKLIILFGCLKVKISPSLKLLHYSCTGSPGFFHELLLLFWLALFVRFDVIELPACNCNSNIRLSFGTMELDWVVHWCKGYCTLSSGFNFMPSHLQIIFLINSVQSLSGVAE